ncbi:16S rRNA (guanine(966)-N(2))-methyltransferase RsmD [Herbaspirillum sp.]|jgi:16S rRNA (guanine966-N2)-methyltransferase|uniref:16S rRNA (guanine(966)-N(2))-methyltransferase RsmD n=1 Tax=Herbaspirillum TaxID=963 RepID=UPI00258FBC7E|nr:16S rRNA (guanine(966)-N(2))-methyltransferase RsmD [Herbaspirillum sp.]MCP3654818.1 16S rRNA (guanine(966)-N(2))-methyltransferase RsmD [Herbaspirillum sp.]MCP3949551.1 16S rRNA (guanine(966)-N(2))-methyltransferase RsmD [Herbaspirillum sp.]MCP4032917.1 16S rRNA (guanine(966)-N(2))-methyltransferase RsmD [Herbaspirillum sp.]MCP4558810.1 16S rRNA (guanine(966)-N(2))-methyltransferase RsmD [Herbaspirillum sp.]
MRKSSPPSHGAPSKGGKPSRPVNRGPHQVRIIGGQWKRTPLPVLDAEGLRPTPDRVRETVFNWITHLIDGGWEQVACLDLFAGSGALGFEAASRGARRVVMVENSGPAVRQLEANRDKLKADKLAIVRGDALAAVQSAAQREPGGYSLVFIDPPYHQGWLEKVLPACMPLLTPSGLVYAEAEYPLDGEQAPEWMQDWEVVRADKAGMVFYHLLQRKSGTQIEA